MALGADSVVIKHHAAVQSPPAWECFSRTTFPRDVAFCAASPVVAVDDDLCWQDHMEGIVLPDQGSGQEMIHNLCQQSCWSQSQAFSSGLSILWTSAINEMSLIPQP